MNRTARTSLGLGIGVFAGMVAVGCSSGKDASGSGGANATGSGGASATGSGGASATGSGGASATGSGGVGATGAGGGGGANVPLPLVCESTVKNKGICVTDTDMACANGCGPNKAGFKNCNCYSNVWDCPKCEYLPGNDYSCYKLPSPMVACPMDSVDPTLLLAAGSACSAPPCTPCGSAPLITYRDSAGAPKAGYCVCVPGADFPKWSCASVTEWPPQQ